MIRIPGYQPGFQPGAEASDLRIVVGRPGDAPHGSIDGRVLEEDTFLVLSANPEAEEVRQRPRALLREARSSLPKRPGSVIVRDDVHPVEFIAIVHDLEEEPTWREKWVVGALRTILREAYDRDLTSLAITAFGAKHPSLTLRLFAEMFRDAIEKTGAGTPEHVWLEIPAKADVRELQPLHQWIV